MSHPPLPQLAGGLFLGDGGLETSLIYGQGVALPEFAAFPLLDSDAGRAQLQRYYQPFLELCAATPGAGFLLDTPTWRASADWGARLGYDAAALAAINRDAVQFVRALRDAWQPRIAGPIVLTGVIGPRGDGYVAALPGSVDEASAFHQPQAEALRDAGADMLAAVTMTSMTEALGVARAAHAVGLPVSISFTVETDGRLPSGERLREAIEGVDADALAQPAYFGVNCAHPSHFAACFEEGGAWLDRIRCVRANASARSHAELDAATEIDLGDMADLADRYVRLRSAIPKLNVLGGCCGTDERHMKAICEAWMGKGAGPAR